ncbi:MAG: hypothetical protein QOG10_1845, partial [Kribbellaceae bacterium]|nr:hypothetical protein [Kribbellaceae bacterium]
TQRRGGGQSPDDPRDNAHIPLPVIEFATASAVLGKSQSELPEMVPCRSANSTLSA